jgi:hypothetical protein
MVSIICGDDEDSHLGDFIEDTTLELPLDSATSESLRSATHDVYLPASACAQPALPALARGPSPAASGAKYG